MFCFFFVNNPSGRRFWLKNPAATFWNRIRKGKNAGREIKKEEKLKIDTIFA